MPIDGLPPKARSPIVCWALVLITGGLYSIYWTWRIANEVNAYEGSEILRLKRWRALFIFLHAAALMTLVWAIRADEVLPFVFVLCCLLGLYIYVQTSIGNYLKAKDKALGTGDRYSNAVFMFLFWIVANSGVIYMQAALNRVAAHGQSDA